MFTTSVVPDPEPGCGSHRSGVSRREVLFNHAPALIPVLAALIVGAFLFWSPTRFGTTRERDVNKDACTRGDDRMDPKPKCWWGDKTQTYRKCQPD